MSVTDPSPPDQPGGPAPLVPPPNIGYTVPEQEMWRPATPRPVVRDRVWLHVLLLVLTFITTTLVGQSHYASFLLDFVQRPLVVTSQTQLLLGALWYSVTILTILGAHEMGHYFACRYYGVDASLPYFLPMPAALTGTLGAFIRIRTRIPTKPQLFDIGVAGPIAGFVLAVPAMIMGIAMSHVARLPPNFVGFELGEPLLFKAASWVVWGQIPEGYSLNLHPMAFAAWFGLLATALNLFPIGQLDGGHISYAVFGRRSINVTYAAIGTAILLTFFSTSWLVWTILLVVMLFTFGPRHPSTYDEDAPLDRPRVIVAFIALLIFVACFTPAPIEPYELIRPR
ncbi:MAG: site-2 protease family protein [Vicinamibacterales bacterium]